MVGTEIRKIWSIEVTHGLAWPVNYRMWMDDAL